MDFLVAGLNSRKQIEGFTENHYRLAFSMLKFFSFALEIIGVSNVLY